MKIICTTERKIEEETMKHGVDCICFRCETVRWIVNMTKGVK